MEQTDRKEVLEGIIFTSGYKQDIRAFAKKFSVLIIQMNKLLD